MSSYPQNPPQPIKSLLYWRRSKVNGSATVPVVMTLDAAGLLSMQGQDLVTMFAVPAAEVTVRFSRWGTIILTVHGRRYDVVGAPAPMSEEPSPAQVAAVGGHSDDTTVLKAWQVALPLAGARVSKSAVAYYALSVGAAVAAALVVLLVTR